MDNNDVQWWNNAFECWTDLTKFRRMAIKIKLISLCMLPWIATVQTLIMILIITWKIDYELQIELTAFRNWFYHFLSIFDYMIWHLLGHCGGLKLPNTLSSYIDASAMNKKYQTIRMAPRRLSSFHPFKWTDMSKNTTVDSNEIVEYVSPV